MIFLGRVNSYPCVSDRRRSDGKRKVCERREIASTCSTHNPPAICFGFTHRHTKIIEHPSQPNIHTTMKSFIFALLLAILVASCSAFQSAQNPRLPSTGLGLFGGKKPPAKNDNAWLEGQGKRITVRDDEDAAMWIEEPKDNKKKVAGKKPEAKKDDKPKKKGWFS